MRVLRLFLAQSLVLALTLYMQSQWIVFSSISLRVFCFLLISSIWSVVIVCMYDRSRWLMHVSFTLCLDFFLIVHTLYHWSSYVDAGLAILFILIFGWPRPGRVPLFLTGTHYLEVLSKKLPKHRICRFLDIGSGLGDVVLFMAKHCSLWHCEGCESAILPYLISRARLWISGIDSPIRHHDFYHHSFSEYDILYAFLSPEHMSSVWSKAQKECRSGTWLISFRFPIPGMTPLYTLKHNKNVFYVYVIS